jgi:hypothetical protein
MAMPFFYAYLHIFVKGVSHNRCTFELFSHKPPFQLTTFGNYPILCLSGLHHETFEKPGDFRHPQKDDGFFEVIGGRVLSFRNVSVGEPAGPDLSGQCGGGKTPPRIRC